MLLGVQIRKLNGYYSRRMLTRWHASTIVASGFFKISLLNGNFTVRVFFLKILFLTLRIIYILPFTVSFVRAAVGHVDFRVASINFFCIYYRPIVRSITSRFSLLFSFMNGVII